MCSLPSENAPNWAHHQTPGLLTDPDPHMPDFGGQLHVEHDAPQHLDTAPQHYHAGFDSQHGPDSAQELGDCITNHLRRLRKDINETNNHLPGFLRGLQTATERMELQDKEARDIEKRLEARASAFEDALAELCKSMQGLEINMDHLIHYIEEENDYQAKYQNATNALIKIIWAAPGTKSQAKAYEGLFKELEEAKTLRQAQQSE